MPGFHFLPDLTAQPATGGPGQVLQRWLDARIARMAEAFAAPPTASGPADPEALLRVFLHHDFTHQSRGKTAHLAPALRETLAACIAKAAPIPVFFLFHGGYRAAVGGPGPHVFAPDQTELMLLGQIARLKTRIEALHEPGLRFIIVINNGVAAHTNGIPLSLTNGYVAALRALIDRLGAAQTARVLNQAELGDFEAHMARVEVLPKPAISETDHGIVQRFLGRPCSPQEACLKLAVYEAAETVWGAQVREMVTQAGGFFCRQVAHPACLSFRPYPGGAIRVQNGAVTFRIAGGEVTPGFVTPLTWDREPPIRIGLDLPLFRGLGEGSALRRAG